MPPSVAPTVAIVDAYSSANRLAPLLRERGHRVVHVQSTGRIPAVSAPQFVPEDFDTNIVHRGDPAATASVLAEHRPVAVLPGGEVGVELADALSESLGLRTNGTAKSAARRDKFRMVETVRAAGLRGVEQLMTSDEDEAVEWAGKLGGRVVVKPVRSSGSEGVRFCESGHEVRAAVRAVLGKDNAVASRNDAILVQEYLFGTEYYVNTVSMDGRHHVCDIWRTTHISANGVRDLLDGAHLLPRRGEVQEQLVAYTFAVLDALGVANGPAHTELKLTPDGPCLIESGARLCGGGLPTLVRTALGESQLEWTADAYLAPDVFLDRCGEDYRIERYIASIGLIAPRSGTLVDYPRLPEVRTLESFHELKMAVAPGDPIHRTVDDFKIPLLVNLAHEVEEIVRRDHGTIRQLDGDGFYTIG
ncbi:MULTISPECIES: ATP-grasp domain-containing protein [Streptomyces]|uniref:ATP-grasp domain-containing protein n=1 Tax=Streptomyces desertarenae TaxID=2666184 RepID=A0ABW4PHM1_9ACTN